MEEVSSTSIRRPTRSDMRVVRNSSTISSTLAAADRTAPGWSERAYDAIRRFAAGQAGAFTIEMLREVVAAEIDPPHDLRAWGPITKKAMRKDVIQLVRGATAPAASSNGSPKPLYKRGVGCCA